MTETATSAEIGHRAHIQAAAERGLAGAMPRPIKVTMLGAGSMFTPELVKDLFLIPDRRVAIVRFHLPRAEPHDGHAAIERAEWPQVHVREGISGVGARR